MTREPVLIVGSGPSGLVTALTLAKNGVPVRVIEKELTRYPGERGAGMMPRTLELHKILGTLPDVLEAARPPPLFRHYDPLDGTKLIKEGVQVPYFEPTPQIPYSNVVMLGQHRHEKILRSHLEAFGMSVEYGTELRTFKEAEDHVLAEIVRRVDGKEVVEEVRTPYLVGMDGAHSVVRRTLGLEFPGETREEDNFVFGDIRVKELMKFACRWGGPKGAVFLRPTGHDDRIAQFMISGPNVDVQKILASREALVEAFYEITNMRDIVFEDLICAFRYKPNIRMVNEVRAGRVFVGGDAAHCHSPVGGQGMNSCVQDAINLAWKLALVYKGYSSSKLLDTYGEERLPVIAEMLGKTTKLLNQVKATGGREAQRGNELRQLGINYRGSSIVYEDGAENATEKGNGYNDSSETAARPGDRAPGAPGLRPVGPSHQASSAHPIIMHDLFSPSRHTILLFSNAQRDCAALLEVLNQLPKEVIRTVLILPPGTDVSRTELPSFDDILIDEDNHAYPGYHIAHKPSIVVIRPDGIIGARVHDALGLKKYFQKILDI
ncbi:hypothetical protein CPC08DRAFT_132812 [Agrocybe pediades]|nr:hypothetical protein CPC08DRAFT_132812 [Agrocybe pediades]